MQRQPHKLAYGKQSPADRFVVVRELLLLLGVSVGIMVIMALLGRWAQLHGIINVVILSL